MSDTNEKIEELETKLDEVLRLLNEILVRLPAPGPTKKTERETPIDDDDDEHGVEIVSQILQPKPQKNIPNGLN